jgi:hypothetical protein
MRKFIIVIIITNIICYLSVSIFNLSFNLLKWNKESIKAYTILFGFLNLVFVLIYLVDFLFSDENKGKIR